jgi:hypothetical protein
MDPPAFPAALATAHPGGNIQRVKHRIRRLVGAVVTASFALSAVTWGSMPGCSPAQAQNAHAGHHHGSAPAHAADPGKVPASVQCFVHLCCLQLVAPAASKAALERLSPPEGLARLTIAGSIVPIRSSHTLPFAHAPPPAIA